MKKKVARKARKLSKAERVIKPAPKTDRLSLARIKRAVARVLKEKEEEAAREAS